MCQSGVSNWKVIFRKHAMNLASASQHVSPDGEECAVSGTLLQGYNNPLDAVGAGTEVSL